MGTRAFPDSFRWGTATSAQQIEGGRRADGRADSIWDVFADAPGNIEDGSNPTTTCDHFNRWRQDIELMQWLGTKVRLSKSGKKGKIIIEFYSPEELERIIERIKGVNEQARF